MMRYVVDVDIDNVAGRCAYVQGRLVDGMIRAFKQAGT